LIWERTRDETTVRVCLRLFARARTLAEMAALGESTIHELLSGGAFAGVKAATTWRCPGKSFRRTMAAPRHARRPDGLSRCRV
jgi:endonuclease III